MASIKLILDKRRIKDDGTYPLSFRLSHNGKSRDIATGYSVPEKFWNTKTSKVKRVDSDLIVISNRLKELEVGYLTKLITFEKSAEHNSDVQYIKEFITAKQVQQLTVSTFWQQEIDQLKQSKRFGNARTYEFTLNVMKKVKSLDIPFEKLDYTFLKQVEATLLGRGVKLNSISVYLRTLRAVYNSAIRSKVVSLAHYPFSSYKIKKTSTTPKVLLMSEIQSYFRLNLNNKSYLYDSWLLGKLMFMLMGINFKDLVMLRSENLKGERVFYHRAKTKKLYSIKLLSDVVEIINYFKNRDDKTILGMLSEDDLTSGDKFPLIIRQKNKVFNAHLNKIGKMIGSNVKLTSYVFRYTYANVAKQLGYSKDLIAEALGHEYGNQITGIYLECYDKELIDAMNEKIHQQVV